ncbi:MAG: HAD-IA family hydrolase [Candidatus Geothermarchaeota archaeon]
MKVVLTFDCYGTLIDWISGIKEAVRKLFTLSDAELDKFVSLWLKKDQENVRSSYRKYRDIVKDNFKYALEAMNVKYSLQTLDELADSIKLWRAFPDVRSNLLKLKEIGEIYLVSNTDNEFIKASINNIGVSFDEVITAEDLMVYKPNLAVFRYVKEKIHIKGGEFWIHISSYLSYDIKPAKLIGAYTILLDRYNSCNDVDVEYADEIYKSFSKLTSSLLFRFRKGCER